MMSWFTLATVGKVFGALWGGFCKFIVTPIGAAILAASIAYFAGSYIAERETNAAWQTKWDVAEANAERDRLARDALVKAKVEADANSRTAEIAKSKTTLEGMVKDYEDAERASAATAGTKAETGNQCLTDRSDAEWLSRAQRAVAKPEARRGLAQRLRAIGR